LGAAAVFPFGGPPHRPFFQWALRSGRAFASPVRLLVHDRAGLMVSYRGAIALREALPATPAPNPCTSCTDKPCLSACPVGALGGQGYDLAACHAFLDRPEGGDCLSSGCAVRRACPLSQAYGRLPEQSAYHMRLFHK
ncbi:MAG: ferredoxin, partial [Proteobacteria bacterium]|nr:ferredoxin [Pseudomonadota bacterium]